MIRRLFKVSSAFKRITAGKEIQISVGGLEFGASAQDKISVLSEVFLPVPIPPLGSGSSIDISKFAPWAKGLSIDSFKPILKSVDLETVNDGLNLKSSASLNNPTPVNLKVGYFAAEVIIDGTRFVGATISDLKVGSGQQEASVGIHVGFGRASELKIKVCLLLMSGCCCVHKISLWSSCGYLYWRR